MKSNRNKINQIGLLAVLFVVFVSCNKEHIKLASETKTSALLPNGFEDVTGCFNVYGEKNTNNDPVPLAVYLVTYDAPSNKLIAYKKYSNDGQKIGDVEWEGVYSRATMEIQRHFVNGLIIATLDIINKDQMTIISTNFPEQIRMVRRVAKSY